MSLARLPIPPHRLKDLIFLSGGDLASLLRSADLNNVAKLADSESANEPAASPPPCGFPPVAESLSSWCSDPPHRLKEVISLSGCDLASLLRSAVLNNVVKSADEESANEPPASPPPCGFPLAAESLPSPCSGPPKAHRSCVTISMRRLASSIRSDGA